MRNLSPLEKTFLEDLFTALDTARCKWCLLRNYGSLPEQIGNDLDIFVPFDQLNSAFRTLNTCVADNHGTVYHIHKRSYFQAIWIRFDDSCSYLHVDLYPGAFEWHGLRHLDRERTLSGLTRYRELFPILRPAHEAWTLAVTSLLWGASYKRRYHERIIHLLSQKDEFDEFSAVASIAFGKEEHSLIEGLKTGFESDEQCAHIASRMRSALFFRRLRILPFDTLLSWSKYWYEEWLAYFRSPGLTVAFLGPDGSGKSTVIQSIKSHSGMPFGDVVIHHLRPRLLPDFGCLIGSRTSQNEIVTNPHGRKPHGGLASVIRFLYYCGDYLIGWIPRVWFLKGRNYMVIFDRYIEDMHIDPLRFRFSLSRAIIKRIAALLPHPDLTFILNVDPEVIQKRKQEVPLPETRAQCAAYLKLAAEMPRCHIVDAAQPVQHIVQDVENIVADHLRKRLMNVSPTR